MTTYVKKGSKAPSVLNITDHCTSHQYVRPPSALLIYPCPWMHYALAEMHLAQWVALHNHLGLWIHCCLVFINTVNMHGFSVALTWVSTNIPIFQYIPADIGQYILSVRKYVLAILIFSSWLLHSESAQQKLCCGFSLGSNVRQGQMVACNSTTL